MSRVDMTLEGENTMLFFKPQAPVASNVVSDRRRTENQIQRLSCLWLLTILGCSQDSAFGIATRCRLDGQGF